MTSETIDINFKAEIFQQLKELKDQFGALNGKVETIEKTSKSSFDSISKSLKAISFVNITQGLQNLNQGFQDLNAPGLKFSTSMADMSAITGLTGKQLDVLGEKARANAKEFGGTASQSVETYKLLLSQLTPELAKQPKVLDAMARNVSLLSKTMGGNTLAATEVLTTAMNQYGVSLDDPIKAQKEMTLMMNIMSAAAKEGSSELPTIKQALENVGGQAKLSGLSFAELNSAIQSLDKAGKKGAEGGTALRTILTTLGKGRFLPKQTAEELEKAGIKTSMLADKNVAFTDKMRMLKPVLEKDSELISTLFGEYGQAASALIQTAGAQDKMTKAISNTNTTEQQAKIVMESKAEQVARMNASIEDSKIKFFEATNGATAYLEPISQLATTFSAFVPLISGSASAVKWLTKTELASTIATSAATSAQWLWNVALNANPIGLLITGIAVATAGVYALTKAMEQNTASEQVNAEVKQRVIDQTIDETVELDLLFDKLRSVKVGTDEYKSALSDLESKYPGILEKYDLQKGKIQDINRAQKELLANIQLQAEYEATKQLLTEEIKGYKTTKFEGKTGLNAVANALTGTDAHTEYLSNSLKKQEVLKKQLASLSKKVNKDKTSPDSNSLNTPENNYTVSPSGSGVPANNSTPEFSSTGGGIKNITVHIQNLVKEINVSTTNITQGLGEIKQQVTEAMVSAVRNYETAQ